MIKIPVRLHLLSKAFYFLAFLLILTGAAQTSAAVLPPCAGTLNVCRFRVMIQPAKGGTPLPLQAMNIIDAGQKVRYEPLHLPPTIRDRAKIALLVVGVPKSEVEGGVKNLAGNGQEVPETDKRAKQEAKEAKQAIHVLDAMPAKDVQEWVVPARASVVGLVFGPHGLDVKKVNSMVVKNPDLIPQLTEYAEETAKVGALVEALSEYQQQPDRNRDVNAALVGFGNDYNVAVPKLDTTQPSSQQAALLMQAMMPSLQSFDPITASPMGMVAQSAGLAGAVGTMFFGSPVGLAAGGAAMIFNLRTLAFPDTDFRSAFTQPFDTTGLALCAKNEPDKPRMRTAYLWMMKVPNTSAPSVALTETAHLPLGGRSIVKVPLARQNDSRLLLRAHGWQLVASNAHAEIPVKVQVGTQDDSLDLDLTQTKLPPGEYQLAALWDWDPLAVKGAIDLRPVGEFTKVKVTPESADRLVVGPGAVKVQLTGADFEFVDKVAMVKVGDKKATPRELSFTLPKGKAQGEQESMDTDVDTAVEAGTYHLILTQSNGSSSEVRIDIHPPNPTLDGLPLRVNVGESQQTVTLRGTRLERITHLAAPNAIWELASVKPDAHDLLERKATVKLQPAVRAGEVVAASVSVQDIQSPLIFPGGVQVDGPRPKIGGVNLSVSQQPDVHLNDGEIPAGSPISFSLLIHNVDAHPVLGLNCANAGFTKAALVLHPGDRSTSAQLDFAGDEGLFLSVDPGVVGMSGCQLAATIITDSVGSSDPTVIGRLIRLPRIQKFALLEDKLGPNLYAGSLTGTDLQIIDKTGWDSKTGFPVQGIPTPVPGGTSQEQTLKVELPWPPPSPHAPIYVWLRGETTGRLTDVKY